jgi:hypothetical protein
MFSVIRKENICVHFFLFILVYYLFSSMNNFTSD